MDILISYRGRTMKFIGGNVDYEMPILVTKTNAKF